jgi:hypothetical protein
MTLHLIEDNKPVLWTGQKIKGISHPRNIEKVWSVKQLSFVGLHICQPADPVPEGKQIVSTSTQVIDGGVKVVHEIKDIPVEMLDAERRSDRNDLLQDTDWEMLKKLETLLPETDPLRVYRQALRDVPENGFIFPRRSL